MTSSLDRDRQIALMLTASERMESRADAWAKVPVIREALRRAPEQVRDGYSHQSVRLVRVG